MPVPLRALAPLLLAVPTCGTRFLIVRHGQTDHNAQGIIQGSSDVSRLTAKGREQAQLAGAALAAQLDLISFDHVFVSTLSRAQETLDVLAPSLPPLPTATVLSELREIDLGSWEGRDKAELQASEPDAYAAWKESPLEFVIDGDTRPICDLWARARVTWEAMRPAVQGTGASGSALVVTHNACGQALLCTALGLDETHFGSFKFPNLGAVELDWSDDRPARWRWRLPLERADGQWRSAPLDDDVPGPARMSGAG